MRRFALEAAELDGDVLRVRSAYLSADEVADLRAQTGYPVVLTQTGPCGGGGTSVDASLKPSMPQFPSVSADAVMMIEAMFQEALRWGASDIHLEGVGEVVRIRFRLDGHLRAVHTVPRGSQSALVARIKVLARLDLAEKRRPQDGRLSYAHGGSTVDVRVSVLPTEEGEKVVLRLLDRSSQPLDLAGIGMPPSISDSLTAALDHPHGLILVTGPTGSGKTTTLYAALQYLNREGANLLTIEDPVEYRLPGVSQANVRADLGFTFAAALRSFLRQDPDVILVGEIRDTETAQIAVRAALTGHLVLSTLHTNDAPSTISRLFDIGVEPYLLASCLRLVIAQRLVRRVCTQCAAQAPLPAHQQTLLGLESTTFASGQGCPHCLGTGFKGRVPLFESMKASETLAESIGKRESTAHLRNVALHEGMVPLRQFGGQLVAQQITTPSEVLRATG